MDKVSSWKKFLKQKGFYSGETNSEEVTIAFKRGMRVLDSFVSDRASSARGMIWTGKSIGSQASIRDVSKAIDFIGKFGVATLDALGPPPSVDDRGIISQMFISQEDSKLDEWTPEGNQNQGTKA